MKVILKRGQALADAFPAAKWSDLFPVPQSSIAKRLNAQKFVGVLNLTEDPLDAQRRMRDEWEQDTD